MKAVQPESGIIGPFLEWLQARGIELCRPHEHSEGCGTDKWGRLACNLRADELVPIFQNTEQLLAEYFGIDLKKIGREKEAMYRELAAAAEVAP